MAWIRLNDAVPEHRKHLKAGPAACWLWVCGIAYCQRQLSDGFIPDEAMTLIGVGTDLRRNEHPTTLAKRLVRVGLFDRVPGGYRVHDYHDFNDTREQAIQRKEDSREQRRQAGLASGRVRSTKRERPANEPVERTSNPIPSHPDPSHPIPTVGRQQPLRRLSRFVVFRWQIEKLIAMLGSAADTFDLDLWFDTLNTQAETAGVVIPDEWAFIKAATMAEAQRRGLAVARPDEPRMFKEPTQADIDAQLEMLHKADAQRERDRVS